MPKTKNNKLNPLLLLAAYFWLPISYLTILLPLWKINYELREWIAICMIVIYVLTLFGFGLFMPRWRKLLIHTAGIYVFLHLVNIIFSAINTPGFTWECHDCTEQEDHEIPYQMLYSTLVTLIIPIALGTLTSVVIAWRKRGKSTLS